MLTGRSGSGSILEVCRQQPVGAKRCQHRDTGRSLWGSPGVLTVLQDPWDCTRSPKVAPLTDLLTGNVTSNTETGEVISLSFSQSKAISIPIGDPWL